MTGRRPRRDLPAFSIALEQAAAGEGPAPYCKGRSAEYSDYRSSPGRDEAEELCLPCPLYLACRANARHIKPKWGVVGGIAWENGRQAHLMREISDKTLAE